MAPIKTIEELQGLVKKNFDRIAPCGIKATVAEIMEFIRKETGSPDETWVQKTSVAIINDFAKEAFVRVPVESRAIFPPLPTASNGRWE